MITFDVEPFVYAFENKWNVNEKDMYNAGSDGLKIIIEFLEKLKVKSTFFVVSEFAKRYPKLIRKLVNDGHEVASHGFHHSHKYTDMKKENSLKFLKNGKKILEKITRKKIIGFRAPQMKCPDYSILKDCDFVYDSSLHPTYVPGHYNNFFSNRKIFKKNGIFIVPISVLPIIRAPFSWVWFRNMPIIYSRFCTFSCLIDPGFVNIYFHPWEFIDILNYNLTKTPPKYYIKDFEKKILKKLTLYINHYKQKADFITIRNHLEI